MIESSVGSSEICRLKTSEYDRIASVMGRAFFDYNLMVYAQAAEWRRLTASTVLYGGLIWDCLTRGEVYGTSDGAGIAGWLGPDTPLSTFFQQVQAGLLRLPFVFGPGGFMKLLAYDAVARRLHHQYASEPHWFLLAIGVEPSQQGRGLGSQLLAPMLARADAERMPCWLDTHEEKNVRLYQRHGFEISERAEVPGHPLPVYGMLRRPR